MLFHIPQVNPLKTAPIRASAWTPSPFSNSGLPSLAPSPLTINPKARLPHHLQHPSPAPIPPLPPAPIPPNPLPPAISLRPALSLVPTFSLLPPGPEPPPRLLSVPRPPLRVLTISPRRSSLSYAGFPPLAPLQPPLPGSRPEARWELESVRPRTTLPRRQHGQALEVGKEANRAGRGKE